MCRSTEHPHLVAAISGVLHSRVKLCDPSAITNSLKLQTRQMAPMWMKASAVCGGMAFQALRSGIGIKT